MKWLFALVVLWVAPAGAVRGAAEETVETVMVAELEVRIPMPDGFARIDGVSAEFDAFQRRFLPPTNRMLVYLGPEAARRALSAGEQPDLSRSMNVQVLRALELKNISAKDFKILSKEWMAEMGNTDFREAIKQTSEDASKGVSKDIGEEVNFDIAPAGKPIVLSKGENFLMFGTALDLGISGPEGSVKERGFVAGSFFRVHGKVLNLYCNTNTNTAADRTWARETLESWQAEILGANSALASTMASLPETKVQAKRGKSGGLLGGVLRGALIGAGIGAVVGVIFALGKVWAKKSSE